MQSKYTVAVAAKDQYSKPIEAASAAQSKFTQQLTASRAEIKKLSGAQRDLKSFAQSKESVSQLNKELAAMQAQLKKTNKEQGALVAQQVNLSKDKNHHAAAIATIEKKIAEIRKLEDSGINLSKTQRANFKREIAAHENSIKQHQRELKAIAKKDKAVAASIKLTNADAAARKKQIKGLSTRYEREQKHLNALQRELTKTGIKTDDLAASQAKLKRKTDDANKSLKAQQAGLKRVAEQEQHLSKLQDKRNGMVGDTAKVAVGLYAAKSTVDTAADLESAMVEVVKKATFKNKDGFELNQATQAMRLNQLERYILTSAPDLGLQPGELANIVASGAGSNIARAGYEIEDLKRFSTLAAKMANAFDGLTADAAGQSVAAWKASMSLNMEQLERLAGAINHLSDNSAANTTAITDVMTDVGSVIMSAGMNEVQAASLAAAILAANGNKAEMGRTAAKNLAINMTLGDSASGPKKQMWKSLGFDPVQIAKDAQADAAGTMYKVFEAIRQEPVDKHTAIINTLFGTESIGSMTTLIKNMDEMKRVMSVSNDEVALRNSLDNEFNKLLGTANFQKQRLSSAFTGILAAVGTELLPVYTKGVEALANTIEAGTEFIKNNEEIAGAVIKGVAALAALKAAHTAYRLGALTVEIALGKRKLSETQLGMTVGKTAGKATLAARALDMLNRSLDRTARGGAGGGYYGDYDSADGKKRRRRGRRGGKFNKMARMARKTKMPIVANVAAAGLVASSLADSDTVSTAENVGGIGGSMAGAAAGAALGSIVPIVGTVAGGIIGAILGDTLGAMLGREVGESLTEKPEDVVKKQQQNKTQSESEKPLTVRVVQLDAKSPAVLPEKPHFELDNVIKTQSLTANVKPLQNIQKTERTELKVDYRPTIHIAGDADEKKINKALEESQKSFMDELRKNAPNLFTNDVNDRLDNTFIDGIPTGFDY
ncbi:phage tail tape measure protein [Pseudoalteromonas sp. MMG024]|uniref:phage tail tape measure protein n=1 Tax=Pseudoalteromonas sp. MMG024 TaxID=2909980 RepID=UPI001F008EC5|nr:phage tail tape measure protein [Pseudoalteromonas sp. MMG024]MCF6459108.1 phage tail tape measure protein [Pseudoalteromonas sp. MMG024]